MTFNESMEIAIINPVKDIEFNGWQEVEKPTTYLNNSDSFDVKGLLSEQIFGEVGTEDRKTKWGYINLYDCFMAPHVFYVFSRLKKFIANDLLHGQHKYYIDAEGEITKLGIDEQVPETAIVKELGNDFRWLRKHWDSISWKIDKKMSGQAKIRRRYLKSLSIEEVFWEKLLVIPAFYRDGDKKKRKRNQLNKMYSGIMYSAAFIRDQDMSFFNPAGANLVKDEIAYKIIKETDKKFNEKEFIENNRPDANSLNYISLQNKLNELFDYYMAKIGGANGFINEFAVGKATDYGARLVITTPSYNTEHMDDCEVDFFHSSVPLSVAINIFAPFMVYSVSRWLTNYIAGQRTLRYWDFKDKCFKYCEIAVDYLEEFTSKRIRKRMSRYRDTKHERLDPVTIKGKDQDGKTIRIPVQFMFDLVDGKPHLTNLVNIETFEDTKDYGDKIRNMTYCELFYILAENNLTKKAIYNTRYPCDDFYHTYPSMMNIIPCTKYTAAYINGILYKRYPILKVSNIEAEDFEHLFVDSMRMHSVYPSSLGADFDGDQISTQSLFSEEANAEAIKHMHDVNNVVGINGEIIRNFPTVVKHGIYGLTYKIPLSA